MRWILRKIFIDDPGKAGDGSDAKMHSEIIFEGNEQNLRAKLAELNITNQYVVANTDIRILKGFASNNGYLLYSRKDSNKED